MKDLSRDKTELEANTLKDVLGTTRLTENHLSDLIAIGDKIKEIEQELDDDVREKKAVKAWKDTKYCQECLVSHGAEIAGYGRECIRGVCSNPETWQNLRNLGSELYDYFKPLTRIGDYTKQVFEDAQNFVVRLRAIRKELAGSPGTEEVIK